MNKRQAKKMRKKVSYPLVDEMNLLTYSTQEEYDQAIADFEAYVQKHGRYKHYKDKGKIRGGLFYRFPVGKAYKERYTKNILSTCRKYDCSMDEIMQSMEQLRNQYPEVANESEKV